MTGRTLTLSALLALTQAKAIITNHCSHDVYIWSVPQAGSSSVNNLPLKPGARYEEPWRRGTDTTPGVAIKISPKSNGINDGSDEIDFAYSIEKSDSSKVWVDLSPVRGKAFDNNLAFYTCHGPYQTPDVPTRQCDATDEIELVLCDTGRTSALKDVLSFNKIEQCYDSHKAPVAPMYSPPDCHSDCDDEPHSNQPGYYPPPQPTSEHYNPPVKPTSNSGYPMPQPTSKGYSPSLDCTSAPHCPPTMPTSVQSYSPPKYTSGNHYPAPPMPTSEDYCPPPKPTWSGPHLPEHTSGYPATPNYPNWPSKPTAGYYPPPKYPEGDCSPSHTDGPCPPPKYPEWPSTPTEGPYPPQYPDGHYPPPKPTGGYYPPPKYPQWSSTPTEGPYSPPKYPDGHYPPLPTAGPHPPPKYPGGHYPLSKPTGGYYPPPMLSEWPSKPTEGPYPPQYPDGHYPPAKPSGGYYPSPKYPEGHYPPSKPTAGHYPSPRYPSSHYPPSPTASPYSPPKYPGGHYPPSPPEGYHPPPKYPGGEYPPTKPTGYYPPPKPTGYYPPPKPTGYYPPPKPTPGDYSPPTYPDGHYPSPYDPFYPPGDCTTDGPHYPTPSYVTDYPAPSPASYVPHQPYYKPPKQSGYAMPPRPPPGQYAAPPKPSYQARQTEDSNHCLARVVYPGRRAALVRSGNNTSVQTKPRTTIPLSTVLQLEAAKHATEIQTANTGAAPSPLCDLFHRHISSEDPCDEATLESSITDVYPHLCDAEYQAYLNENFQVSCGVVKRTIKNVFPGVDAQATAAMIATRPIDTHKRDKIKICIAPFCEAYGLNEDACEDEIDMLKDLHSDNDYTTDDSDCDATLDPLLAAFLRGRMPSIKRSQQSKCIFPYCKDEPRVWCDQYARDLEADATYLGLDVNYTSDEEVCKGMPDERVHDTTNSTIATRGAPKACVSQFCDPVVRGVNCTKFKEMIRWHARNHGQIISDIMTSGEESCVEYRSYRKHGQKQVCLKPICSRMDLDESECSDLGSDLEDSLSRILVDNYYMSDGLGFTTDEDACEIIPRKH